MSKETLARVFEPFFTTKERGKGTGLGLAMVYGFAKQSGGTVRIYSEPGYGTTVTLYLRFAEALPAPLPDSAPIVSPAQQTGKVLVVDDEVDLLDIAKSYLEDMGYQAYGAEDGMSALRVLARHGDIDLIVTDIVMPGGMNGVELARKVREVRPDIRVVYSSGFPADALEGRSVPVDGLLLRKPYQRADFETAIRMALE
jgi:CheY-like chemotaxis protein